MVTLQLNTYQGVPATFSTTPNFVTLNQKHMNYWEKQERNRAITNRLFKDQIFSSQ